MGSKQLRDRCIPYMKILWQGRDEREARELDAYCAICKVLGEFEMSWNYFGPKTMQKIKFLNESTFWANSHFNTSTETQVPILNISSHGGTFRFCRT